MTGAIHVMPWPDPVLDALGHDPRSWYVETFRPFPVVQAAHPFADRGA